jgi:hypothetical protein
MGTQLVRCSGASSTHVEPRASRDLFVKLLKFVNAYALRHKGTKN